MSPRAAVGPRTALLFVVVLLSALAAASCTRALAGGRQPPAPGAVALPPRAGVAAEAQGAQLARGQPLYERRCASCHDAEGAIGTSLDRVMLGAYVTARALFDYVKDSMPLDAPGKLPDQDYWDLLAYLLRSRELLPAGMTLGPENAETLRIRK
ncbi:MAG: c-type cytochrome [Gemmatimonadetes bacterium]|nr:c-type cytochrome [Gemmatimonadota bacterium]